MANEKSFPPVPANYVSILDLQERWMKKRQQQKELPKEHQSRPEQKKKLAQEHQSQQQQQPPPPPSQSQRRYRSIRRKEKASNAATAAPDSRSDLVESPPAEESRVLCVEESSVSSVVAADGETGKKKSGKRKKKKGKGPRRSDSKSKESVDENAAGGGDQAPAEDVAGNGVASTEGSKDGITASRVESDSISLGSNATVRKLRPAFRKGRRSSDRNKVKGDENVAGLRRQAPEEEAAAESVASGEELKDEPVKVKIKSLPLGKNAKGMEYRPKIKNAGADEQTVEVEKKFEKLSTRDAGRSRGGYQRVGRGGRDRAYGSLPSEGLWVKKGEKADGVNMSSSFYGKT